MKSSYVAALEIFPDLRLIHLVRDPLKVAASEAYRELWRRRVRAPFHFYRGDDGKRRFAWALTGNEKIFRHFAGENLSLFQWYLLQWIEIENRVMIFLDENNLRDRCFTLDSPCDLNDASKIRALFDFLEIEMKQSQIIFGGRKNKSLGYSAAAAAQNEKEFQFVLQWMPEHYLKIFQREPYCRFSWNKRLTTDFADFAD